MVTSLYRNGNGRLNSYTQDTANLGVVNQLCPLPKTPLFGTDGIRGKVGELLNASLALDLGFCAAQVLKATMPTPGPIIIGQDSRNSSDMLTTAITAGLTSAGVEVWQIGLCPTPCVAYLARNTEAMGGIMISASHNPPEDNGIKFFDHQGLKLSKGLAQQVEDLLRNTLESNSQRESSLSWGKYYHRRELIEQYLQQLSLSIPTDVNLEGMRIVLDLAWGAAVEIAPQVFKSLGAEVICLHDQPDGDRINVNCGSTHLNLLQQAVKEFGADLGVAFDGDADRVLAVDSEGRVVDGDYILYFWGQTLKAQDKLPNNLIIATVMANLGFEKAWQNLGGQLIRTAVGDQHVQAQMWETGAMLGGEQSGHIICHHHGVSGDGIQTALHLAALVRQSGRSLGALVEQSFQPYPQILRNVRVEDRERRCNWKDCNPLQIAIAEAQAAMGDRGRVLVRASGTEPLIRVMVESECAQSANYWTEHLIGVVQKYLA
ncbi:phosphoglucosamine mutase [Gloeothece citriformis PCC 7424]|uniref:Phosphoglucosamine mutase n=1 Tax=Gloeothece citriformis (strain PCC 7424) TaxID=65393 RepID=GLMM_GLOC7|nr:phosphoglucosamine mutase [Gloeothece citriformis]B7KL75.1 RecName: Full=Phosphoglucosamine mutase [Gloeothece citriformis PCC 7424]ACK72447.1 phosphoglucosamine mutase [Gloeothece citriformis PCC 7424]